MGGHYDVSHAIQSFLTTPSFKAASPKPKVEAFVNEVDKAARWILGFKECYCDQLENGNVTCHNCGMEKHQVPKDFGLSDADADSLIGIVINALREQGRVKQKVLNKHLTTVAAKRHLTQQERDAIGALGNNSDAEAQKAANDVLFRFDLDAQQADKHH